MRRLRRLCALVLARVRARWFGRHATLGRKVRFGPGVRCHVESTSTLKIGDDVEIGANSLLKVCAGGELLIGPDVFIAALCTIAAERHISIGSESMLAEMVSVRDHDHDPGRPPKSGHTLQSDLDIGRRVWIGAKASVVRGASIGDDAVIGANAVVNRPVPANCLAVGVPAEVKRRDIRPGRGGTAADGGQSAGSLRV